MKLKRLRQSKEREEIRDKMRTLREKEREGDGDESGRADSALNNVVSVRGKPMSDTSRLREERMKFREDLQRHTDGAEALLDLHESAKNPEPEDITKMIHD